SPSSSTLSAIHYRKRGFQCPESDCFMDSREVTFLPSGSRRYPVACRQDGVPSKSALRQKEPTLDTVSFYPLVFQRRFDAGFKLEGMHVSRVERYLSATYCQRTAGVRGRLCKLAAAVVSGGARLQPVASGCHRDDHTHRVGIAHICHWT